MGQIDGGDQGLKLTDILYSNGWERLEITAAGFGQIWDSIERERLQIMAAKF